MSKLKTSDDAAGAKYKTPKKLKVQPAPLLPDRALSKEAFGSDTEKAGAMSQRLKAVHQKLQPAIFPKFNMGVSENGLHLIRQFEGFRPQLYNDPVGHCTIGYGTLVHRGVCNGSEPAEFRQGLSEERATQLLMQKVVQFAEAINRLVLVPLNQNQFDALVSFVYNVGAGALQRSTLLKELNRGHYDRVPAELRKWVKAGGRTLPGLVKRRAAEAILYQKDVTVPSPGPV